MSRALALKAALAGTLAFGALVVPTTNAQAQDRLNFGGSVNLYDQPGSGGENLLLDFLVNGATGGTPDGTFRATESISGAFATAVNVGDNGTISDLVVSPSSVVGMPIDNFVTIGPFTFRLEGVYDGTTFGPISLFPVGNSTSANFGVFGTVYGGAFGDMGRAFQGTFTAQFTGMNPTQVFNEINSGRGLHQVAFSAEFVTASVVPEPSTYILLATGLGVLGLVGLRRRGSNVA